MAKTDLLMSEDFKNFLHVVVQEGHGVVKMLVDGNIDQAYFKGAMQMFRAMIKTPAKYADARNEEQQEMARALISDAFRRFEAKMLRSYFDDDEP